MVVVVGRALNARAKTKTGLRLSAALWIGAALVATNPTAVSAASFVNYYDRAAFDAATGGGAVQDFNSQQAGASFSSADYGDFTLTYDSKGGPLANSYRANTGFGSGVVVAGNTYHDDSRGWYSSYVFEFDEAITSFGGNFLSGNIGRIVLDVLGTSFQTPSLTAQNDYFFGITSDTAFTRIELRGSYTGSPSLSFDNITYSTGAAAAVPEPATWAMMIVGFGLTGGALRSSRRRPVAPGMAQGLIG